ncbi:hypothetical protein D3C71_77520 [compost metagenome]
MTNDNAPVDDMETYLSVFDLLAEMLKEPEFLPVMLATKRPYGKPNDASTASMELKLTHNDQPLLLVRLETTQVGGAVKCNYLAVHVADGPVAEMNPNFIRYHKIVLPMHHYGDLLFGSRFAAAFLAECALLAMKDEDVLLGMLAKAAFDRAQNRMQALYHDTSFSFYPQPVTRKKAEVPA